MNLGVWSSRNAFRKNWEKKVKWWIFWSTACAVCSRFHRKITKWAQQIWSGIFMKNGTTLASLLCKLKQKTEKEDRKTLTTSLIANLVKWNTLGKRANNFEPEKSSIYKRDVKNKVSTNGISNHLKHNKKHQIDWDGAVFIDWESHFMRRKIKESIYIHALDASEKHTKIMNLEKGVYKNPCWNEFFQWNSEDFKMMRNTLMPFLLISMYFHCDRWTLSYVWKGSVDGDLSKKLLL